MARFLFVLLALLSTPVGAEGGEHRIFGPIAGLQSLRVDPQGAGVLLKIKGAWRRLRLDGANLAFTPTDAPGPPVPADAIFVNGLAGAFDGIVCMYHDQANIARKLQPMERRVTLFMGLPVVCGTTAHGTAFDIAGQGIADPGSLAAALRYTVKLAS